MHAPTGPGDLIGRQAELDGIDRFLGLARRHPSGLVLEGEAGIGKTSLWCKGVERARARGFRVLSTRPGGADVQLSFAGVADLLGAMDEQTRERLPPPQRRALAAALLVEDVSDEPLDDRAVSAAFLSVLRVLAEDRTCILAVDDVQWLDAASMRVLDFALRRLEAEPVGILATARTDDRSVRAGELVRTIGEGRAERIELGPLSLGATHELLRWRLDLRLSRPTLVRLHATCGGNPFYALQIGEALRRSGREPVAGEPLPVPRDLGKLVRERLVGLSSRTRTTLLLGAALAEPSVLLLWRATGDPAAVEHDLDEAERAGIVQVLGPVVRFAHPLFASVHYASAPAAERRAAHRRLADVVGSGEERARHLALAAAGPDGAVAGALEEAARGARARGATPMAAQLFEQAVSLTPEDDQAGAQRRRVAAAEAHFASGGTARARDLLESALAEAEPGNERADILYRLGMTTRAVDGARSIRLLQEAAEEAQADDGLRAKVLCGLSHWVYAHHVGMDALERAARSAVELAEHSGDHRTLAVALGQLGGTRFMRDDDVPAELMERAVVLEEESGEPSVDEDGGPAIQYATMLLYAGRLAPARELLERLCERARRTGEAGIAHPLQMLAYLEFYSGRWGRAEAAAREALDVSLQSGRESEEVGARSALGLVLGGRGELDPARRHLERGLAAAERSGRGGRAPRSALAMLELSVGNAEAAWGWLEPAVAFVIPLGVLMLRPEVALAIDVLLELGRVRDAEAILDPFEEAARKRDRPWALAAAMRCRGLALAARDRLPEAESTGERAVELAELSPNRLELPLSLLALGTVQRRLGRKQGARATLGRALASFEDLGARLWAERVRRELGRIGGRVPYEHELSATEESIAELVAEGRSNKQIAAGLHLSVKTVEWNLSKLYRKLGVRSRTELAAALRRG
jgi:DNA-binding CsgD family transcriptional regulator